MPDAPEHIAESVPLPPGIALIEPVAGLVVIPADGQRRPRRRRNHVEQFRTDDAEHAELVARSREAGLSIGAYMRSCALGDAGPRAKKRLPVNGELVARANAEMNRAGNNLNQIAARMNSGDEVLRAAHARVILELREVLGLYRQAAGYDRQG